jgi:alcohol dehydrogenase
LANLVTRLVEKAQLPQRLSERGVERDRLPELAADAAKQWTGTFNPRTVGDAELLALYEQAM